MKKWILSAIVYLGIVIVGYFSYDTILKSEQETSEATSEHHVEELKHEEHASDEENSHSEDSHAHGAAVETESEVRVTVDEKDKALIVTLKDSTGQPVTDLEINHDKRLHLIVVDEHLDGYEHLHPSEVDPGVFEVASPLEEGNYKVFVDIKSKSLAYSVQPVSLTVGNPSTSGHSHDSLKIDEKLVKTVGGQKVTLETTTLKAGEPVTLTFTVHDTTLEPYLGAMGHVVILDEQAGEYIHVHPLSDDETIFETQFSKPGIYKIWGEFQQNGKVGVYPFVVEVK